MTELMTRVLNAIPPGYAVRMAAICEATGAERPAVAAALHSLQDSGHVFLRNGFYWLSEAAKAERARA